MVALILFYGCLTVGYILQSVQTFAQPLLLLTRTWLVSEAGGASFWFPEQASSFAASVDWLFYFVYYVGLFCLFGITAFMIYSVCWYHSKPGGKAQGDLRHHLGLELTWTIVPALVSVFIFYVGMTGYIDIRTAPRITNHINVIGQKWFWSFVYDNGAKDSKLHVPVDEATELVMRSDDVIHSFFIPAFRAKMDVVPGRYNKMWFKPNKEGTFQVFCTEYCGSKHSAMLTEVVVHSKKDYEAYIRDLKDKDKSKNPADLGKELYSSQGCQQCHSLDGSKIIGPTFKGIYGRHEKFADGSELQVDENYIRESILMPMAKVVAGYPPVMPAYQGKLSDTEIAALIAFLKTLQ